MRKGIEVEVFMRKKRLFKIRKAFHLILISYFIILMLPITMGIILCNRVNEMKQNEIIKNVHERLSSGIEMFVKQTEQLDLLSAQIINSMNIFQIRKMEMPQMGATYMNDILKVWDKFQSYRYALSDFQDFALILDNEHIYTINSVVFGLEHYHSTYMRYQYPQYEEWEYGVFTQNDVGRRLFGYERVTQRNHLSKGLVYQYSVGINAVNGKRTSAIQCLFSEAKLEETFTSVLDLSGTRIHILDKDLKEMVTIGGDEVALKIPMKEFTKSKGDFLLKQDGSTDMLIYQKIGYGNYTIAASIPNIIIQDEMKVTRQWIFSIIGCVLLIEIGLGIYFAWKYSKPINNLISNIEALSKTEENSVMRNESVTRKNQQKKPLKLITRVQRMSEYDYLELGMINMIHTQEVMKENLEARIGRERKSFLKDLFEHRYYNEEEIENAAQQVNIQLTGKKYCVVSYFNLTVQQWEQLSMETPYIIAVSCCNPQYLSILLGFPIEMDNNNVMLKIESFTNKVNMLFDKLSGCQYPTGVGRIYDKETQIHFSYMQSQYSAIKDSELRKNGVLFYETIASDIDMLYYPLQTEERLINSVQHGETNQVKEIFEQIRIENLKYRKLSKHMHDILVSNLHATLIKVYSDMITDDKVTSIISESQNKEDICTTISYLEECFIQICMECKEKDADTKQVFEEYIEANYSNTQLGIAMAAKDFELSESYFSRYFKEVMGEVFSSYLENVRMKKAKELLKTGQSTVIEISELVGYSNSNTFRRAFRRIVGVSPSEWKQETNATT